MNLKFKTLTFKIGGLCETNRVENHKSIPIYNIYWWYTSVKIQSLLPYKLTSCPLWSGGGEWPLVVRPRTIWHWWRPERPLWRRWWRAGTWERCSWAFWHSVSRRWRSERFCWSWSTVPRTQWRNKGRCQTLGQRKHLWWVEPANWINTEWGKYFITSRFWQKMECHIFQHNFLSSVEALNWVIFSQLFDIPNSLLVMENNV